MRLRLGQARGWLVPGLLCLLAPAAVVTLETLESGGPVAPVKTAEAEGGAAAESIGTSDGGHSEVRTSGGHGGPVSRDGVSETSEEQPSSAATTAADSETR